MQTQLLQLAGNVTGGAHSMHSMKYANRRTHRTAPSRQGTADRPCFHIAVCPVVAETTTARRHASQCGKARSTRHASQCGQARSTRHASRHTARFSCAFSVLWPRRIVSVAMRDLAGGTQACGGR